MNVLIADDDRATRALLADMVANLDHTATTVSDGVEAIEATTHDRAPDLVLLDFKTSHGVLRGPGRPCSGVVYA